MNFEPLEPSTAIPELGSDPLASVAPPQPDEASNEGDSSSRPAAPPRLPGYNLYNLVKQVAKDSEADAAQKLSKALMVSAERINVKNSKGSTALHACAYLKRWDLAQILLDAGADPVMKNAAGHTFFLTAVKDPSSPWEALFAHYPELLEKHRRFLDRSPSPAQPRMEKRAAKIKKPRQAEPVSENGAEPVVVEAEAPMASCPARDALVAQDWAAFGLAATEGREFRLDRLPLDAQLALAKNAPLDVLTQAVAHGARFSGQSGPTLLRRSLDQQWWPLLGARAIELSAVSVADQKEATLMALEAKSNDALLALVGQGWACADDLVESCEEAGDYDLADALIDLLASVKPREERPLAQGSPKHSKKLSSRGQGQGGGAHPGLGKTAKGKKSDRGAGGARKPRPAKSGSPRRSTSMIANLDRPMKEANEFEYQERKPQAKAPIIIVKKARAPAPESE